MEKENQMYFVNQLIALTKEEFELFAKDWYMLVRILIQPTFIQFDSDEPVPFSPSVVDDFWKTLNEKQQFWLTVGDEENVFVLYRAKNSLLEKIIMSADKYEENAAVILDYQKQRLEKKGLYGYARSYDDFLVNNTEAIEKRELFETKSEIDLLPKMKNADEEIIVDCNQLAGYDIFYESLCLTSCWKMYFSKYYFRLFLKEILLEVQQVESVHELANQLIEITLYHDPLKWDHPVNLDFQQLFRDQMGFNQLVWSNGVGVLKDPFIEYAYRDNMVQTVQYQNNRLQPTEKKAATHFVTRTYDHFKDAYREKRIFGILNTQAYFPWVDENQASMMNYKILNPQLTLDEGLKAYEYYIRSHLEIEVKDDKYNDYTTILQLYIPEEKLRQLPLTKLRKRLDDITVGRTRKSKGSIRFDLKKDKNHLRVVFLSQQKLEQLEGPKIV